MALHGLETTVLTTVELEARKGLMSVQMAFNCLAARTQQQVLGQAISQC